MNNNRLTHQPTKGETSSHCLLIGTPEVASGVSPLRMADPASPSGACGATQPLPPAAAAGGAAPDTFIPPAALHFLCALPLLLAGSAPLLTVQAASPHLTGSLHESVGCFSAIGMSMTRLHSILAPCVSASAPGAKSTRLLGVSRAAELGRMGEPVGPREAACRSAATPSRARPMKSLWKHFVQTVAVAAVVVAIAKRRALEMGLWSGQGRRLPKVLLVLLLCVRGGGAQEGSWTAVASMSTGRNGLGVGVLEGKLYALGGTDGSSRLSSVQAYDPATDQ